MLVKDFHFKPFGAIDSAVVLKRWVCVSSTVGEILVSKSEMLNALSVGAFMSDDFKLVKRAGAFK